MMINMKYDVMFTDSPAKSYVHLTLSEIVMI